MARSPGIMIMYMIIVPEKSSKIAGKVLWYTLYINLPTKYVFM